MSSTGTATGLTPSGIDTCNQCSPSFSTSFPSYTIPRLAPCLPAAHIEQRMNSVHMQIRCIIPASLSAKFGDFRHPISAHLPLAALNSPTTSIENLSSVGSCAASHQVPVASCGSHHWLVVQGHAALVQVSIADLSALLIHKHWFAAMQATASACDGNDDRAR